MARTVATPRPRPSRRQAWLAGRCSPPTAGLEAGAAARRFGRAGGMRRRRSPSAAGPVLLLPAVPARRARPARRRRSPPRLRPVSVAPRRWPAGGMRGPSTPTGGRPSATSGTAPEALASWPLLPVAAGHEARAAGPAPPLPVQEREAALVDGRTWEHVAAAGDGRHRHPLLALAASATWLPWSPAFTLPFCSRLPPLQVPAQRRPRGRRRGQRPAGARRHGGGVLWRRKRCHRFSPASGRRREEAWAAAAPLQSGTRLREEGGVGGGLERAVVAGGMSNRCRLCWDERRQFFFADMDGVVGRRPSGHCYIETSAVRARWRA